MSQKRMFSKKITESSAFLSMPLSTQALYFHLGMNGDDDGVIDNVKPLMRMIGANEDDIHILLSKQFLLVIKDEIVVVRDWHIHNTLKNDRYTPSLYKEQLNAICSIDSDKRYTTNGNKMEPNCFPNITKHNITKQNKELSKKESISYNDIIDEYLLDEELREAMKEFIKSRILNKQKLTNRAVELNCKKVLKMPEEKRLEAINNSIERGWRGIFEPSESNSDLDKRYKEARIKEIENKTKNNIEKTEEMSKKADEFLKMIGGQNDKGTGQLTDSGNQSLLSDKENI